MRSGLVVAGDPELHERLSRLAASLRLILVAGLPGTGKSLVIHQLTHLAVAAGRAVHLLQWDVARPVFEASAAGRRYPVVDGVTHPLVRKAVGLWARRAVAAWERQAAPGHLLIGETPFVGNRLIELAQPLGDDAEPILAAASCRFLIPVPSIAVRRHLEAERERRALAPVHPREREDAPLHVLRDLWRELATVARVLGIPVAASDASREAAFDPGAYRLTYEALLGHRHVEAVPLDVVLPTAGLSVYDFAVAREDLVPRADEADAVVRETEARFPDPAALAREVELWWRPR